MGNPHYSDEGFQCFNPAKNFQLDWYNPAKIIVDTSSQGFTTETLTLVGIGEYDKAVEGSYPVVVKLETGTSNDYFIGFNRATGPNAQNVQGSDQVNIIQAGDGNGYAQSFLQALLLQGQSYSMSIGGKTVTVTVDSIDINSSPGTANITISADGTPFPTNAPTNPPTPAPVSPTTPPTPAPVSPTPPPTPAPTNVNAQIATYDGTLFSAPKCSLASLCDSGVLLNGRANIGNNGAEPNQPNSLDSCTDGSDGSYHGDESCDRIVVSRASGGDGYMTEGEVVTITATVWCWSTGTSDNIDFYYASDASNPVWIKIGPRQQCPGGGERTVTASYTLPQGTTQAVRVNMMYGNTTATDSCVSGSYDDVDDMVITVKAQPGAPTTPAPSSAPPTPVPTSPPTSTVRLNLNYQQVECFRCLAMNHLFLIISLYLIFIRFHCSQLPHQHQFHRHLLLQFQQALRQLRYV